MVVEYKGLPPHDLGTAEIASARLVDGNIEVTLHILDDWGNPVARVVRVEMASSIARSLADDLTAAAAEAKTREG